MHSLHQVRGKVCASVDARVMQRVAQVLCRLVSGGRPLIIRCAPGCERDDNDPEYIAWQKEADENGGTYKPPPGASGKAVP